VTADEIRALARELAPLVAEELRRGETKRQENGDEDAALDRILANAGWERA
jgi:hypothetical protein